MSANGSAESQQAAEDQRCREQFVSAPSLNENTSGYLCAGVTPEEGAEDQLFH